VNADARSAERESLEQIDLMAGEVVSGRVLALVYGTLSIMIAVGLAVLYHLGPQP
jgi:hypothetical protein